MNVPMRAVAATVCVCLVFALTSPSLADETYFYHWLWGDHLDMRFGIEVREGEGPYGPLVFEDSASDDRYGDIWGSVYHTGGDVSDLYVDYLDIEVPGQVYLDGYLGETHIELMIDDFAMEWDPTWFSVVDHQFSADKYCGLFGSYFDMVVVLGDLIEFDLGAELRGSTFDIPVTGDVFISGEEAVMRMDMAYMSWLYLDEMFPGVDYTAVFTFDVSLLVPEPTSAFILAIGGVALLRRRRAA